MFMKASFSEAGYMVLYPGHVPLLIMQVFREMSHLESEIPQLITLHKIDMKYTSTTFYSSYMLILTFTYLNHGVLQRCIWYPFDNTGRFVEGIELLEIPRVSVMFDIKNGLNEGSLTIINFSDVYKQQTTALCSFELVQTCFYRCHEFQYCVMNITIGMNFGVRDHIKSIAWEQLTKRRLVLSRHLKSLIVVKYF